MEETIDASVLHTLGPLGPRLPLEPSAPGGPNGPYKHTEFSQYSLYYSLCALYHIFFALRVIHEHAFSLNNRIHTGIPGTPE